MKSYEPYPRDFLGRRRLVAGVAAFATLLSSSSQATLLRVGDRQASRAVPEYVGDSQTKPRPAFRFNLRAAYPNLRRVKAGYFLVGDNPYDPNCQTTGPCRSVLWFRPEANGKFKQYVSWPSDPKATCRYDELQWAGGTLRYLRTHDECGPTTIDTVFSPSITFMPETWDSSQVWSTKKVRSQTFRYEAGRLVCRGINTSQSEVLGVTYSPDGKHFVRTQTDETQTLAAVAGAPASTVCPEGIVSTRKYQEDRWIAGIGGVSVKNAAGMVVGSDAGLARSMGGDKEYLQQLGHPEWDVRIHDWEPLPQPPATTTSTTTPSGG